MNLDKIKETLINLDKKISSNLNSQSIGIDVSYVDHKEKKLEIFSYSTKEYNELVTKGIPTIGSILLSDSTFPKKDKLTGAPKQDIYIKKINSSKKCINNKQFFHYPPSSFTKNPMLSPSHLKWIKYYKQNNIHGVYIFAGKRSLDNFDLVLFAVIDISSLARNIQRRKIKNILESIMDSDLFGIIFEKFRLTNSELLKHSTRSAISQVLSRNMSHNIGSHVLSKFKSKEEIKNTVNKDIIDYQYVGDKMNLLKLLPSDIDNKYDTIAYFNEYLKIRMDFLADIATTDPTFQSSLYFMKEVMFGFDKNRILLNRISGLSGDFKFDICVRRKIDNTFESLCYNYSDRKALYDFFVSIPNDVLGCHAFYIILENVIRNIAKHSREKNPIIYIDIEDYINNENYFQISIHDNLGKDEKEMQDIVSSRNSAFNQSVLNEITYQLRSENLGSIEMEVCAAYLRGHSVSDIENKFYDINDIGFNVHKNGTIIPPFISAYKNEIVSGNECKYSLGYKLYLNKPKEILIIDNREYNVEIRNKLSKRGIHILNESEIDLDTIYSHQFIIRMNDNNKIDKYIYQNGNLPKRVIKKSDFIKDLNFENEDELIQNIWIMYAEKLLREKNISEINFTYKNDDKVQFEVNINSNEVKKTILVFIDDHGDNWEDKKNSNLYYDLYCSHHRLIPSRVTNSDTDCATKKNQAEYIETILTKVVVLDERIQSNIIIANKKYVDKIPFEDLFNKQGIFIPKYKNNTDMNEIIVNLNLSDFGSFDDINSVAYSLKNYIKSKIKECNFFVIHLGVIEKLIGSGINKDQSTIRCVLKKLFINYEEDFHKIIITSGRGKPNNIPKELSFVSHASLQVLIETLFDKYLLVKLLYNTRKTK